MKGFPKHATSSLQVPSPVGDLTLLSSAEGIAGLFFEGRLNVEFVPDADPACPHLAAGGVQLAEYFAGEREQFDLPLDARGTEFQMAVWEQLSAIPFGETASYLQIAERIDNPKAVRAVGLANGSNPISIIVPCHRVIGASGALTGFGGGLDRKRALLEHEGLLLPVGG